MSELKQCPTCASDTRPQPFAKYCIKHDVCIECGIPRANLDHAPWGTLRGAFQCNPCVERIRLAGIKERQEKGFDHEYTSEIVCPHCGYEFSDSWEAGEGKSECYECKGKFEVERIVDVNYCTSKIETPSTANGR